MRKATLATVTFALFSMGCGCEDDEQTAQADLGKPDGGIDATSDGPAPDTGVPDVAPDVASDVMPDSISDGPVSSPTCSGVEPAAGSILLDVVLQATGDDFGLSDTTITLVAADDETSTFELAPVVVTDTDDDGLGEMASATILADNLEQGLYNVVLGTGGMESVCGTYFASVNLPPTVTDVVPPTASAAADRLVTVLGTGFAPTPVVRFRSITDPDDTWDGQDVAWISPTELSVVVPSVTLAMPVGDYHAFVINPDLLSGQWCTDGGACLDTDDNGLPDEPGIFTVLPEPPPQITGINVDPDGVGAVAPVGERLEGNDCSTSETVLSIDGAAFTGSSEVYLVVEVGTTCPSGTTPDATDPTLCLLYDCASGSGGICMADSIDVPLATCAQGVYGVMVRNPDGQFDVWYVLEITDSSQGHINGPWDAPASLPTLNCGRERHAAVSSRDSLLNGRVYVIGGVVQDDVCGDGSGDRIATDTVEAMTVNVFGTPGPFGFAMQYGSASEPRVLNTLTTPRQGHTAVRYGRRLYAIGGAAADTRDPASDGASVVSALDTTDTATILGSDTRPFISAPVPAGVCDAGSEACLPFGSWFYRVSAVMGASGESLASVAASDTSIGGKIKVCWLPMDGATGYIVYRNPASDGRAQTERLLVAEPAMADAPTPGQIHAEAKGAGEKLCFVDDGGDFTTTSGPFLVPAPGKLRGTIEDGGTLGDGSCAADRSYTYRVSAIVTNASSETHETLAGYPVTFTIRAGKECAAGLRSVALAWDPIPGVTLTSVRIWRDGIPSASDPTEMGLLSEVDGAVTSFVDTGAAFLDTDARPNDGIAPLPAGSLSRWYEMESEPGVPILLGSPREGADSVVVTTRDRNPDTLGAMRTFIFISGGRTSNDIAGLGGPAAEYLLTTERVELDESGWFLDSDADDEWWEVMMTPAGDTIEFNFPRAFYPLVTNNLPHEPTPPPPACPVADADADDDGYFACVCGGTDCNDADPDVHPGAGEICGDGIDQDCDAGCDGADLSCTAEGDGGTDGGGGDGGVGDGGVIECVDVDGDGHENLGCGGDDCNDSNPTICPSCPEIWCDGLDQDCDGLDYCVIDVEFTGEPPLIYLVAMFGDEMWDDVVPGGGSDNQPPTFEAGFDWCKVDDDSSDDTSGGPLVGDLVCDDVDATLWSNVDDTSSSEFMGHDGILYFDWLYNFGTTATESIGSEPSVSSQVYRWNFTMQTDFADPIDTQRESSGANLDTAVGYPAVTRVNSKLFLIGGNDGTGPTDIVQRHNQ